MELPTQIFGQENGDTLVESAVTTASESRGAGPAAAPCSVPIPAKAAAGLEHNLQTGGEEKHHLLTDWSLLQLGDTELLG